MSAASADHVLTSWQTGPEALLLYVALAGWAGVYLLAAARRSPRGRAWPRARTWWFLSALGLVAVIYGSELAVFEEDQTGHIVQHMLVMMAVPPLLAFAAPITLLLRTLPTNARRAVVRQLKDPAFKPLSGRWAPVVLCVDYYLTMLAYQLTPLHSLSEQSGVWHAAFHQYFLLCGMLFWLPVAAVDPVRFRPSPRAKRLMIGAGLPAFALLGAIELAKGDATTGWAYIVSGGILTALAAVVVAARERGPNAAIRLAAARRGRNMASWRSPQRQLT